jgi:hypothetical protein
MELTNDYPEGRGGAADPTSLLDPIGFRKW